MGLFNKEFNCQECGKSTSKKEAYYYDRSHQGYYSDDKAIKVCKDCFYKLLAEDINNFKDKAVVISPIEDKQYNAYVYYTFKILKDMSDKRSLESNTKLISDFKKYLPDNKKCDSCEKEATFTLMPPEAIYNDPFMFEANNTVSSYKHLCKDCLIKQLNDKLEKSYTRNMMPLVSEEGFFVSWQL